MKKLANIFLFILFLFIGIINVNAEEFENVSSIILFLLI